MFFRRTKKPTTDETVLTETLRALQDLISDPQVSPPPQDAETPTTVTDTETAMPAEPAQRGSGGDGGDTAVSSPALQSPHPDADSMVSALQQDDAIPVLNNVVFMPIPRAPATRSAAASSVDEQTSAQKTIADKLISDVEERLDEQGDPIDPRLLEELRNALASSLEDWSLRTQEIILSKLSPKTSGQGREPGDGDE